MQINKLRESSPPPQYMNIHFQELHYLFLPGMEAVIAAK